MFLQVHNASLRWLDPETSSPTLTQPINKIRVWGIGLDNERHFGYVARDIVTKRHKCHVFRCERPARAVARALLEAHQRDRQEKRARKATKKEESAAAKELVKGECIDGWRGQQVAITCFTIIVLESIYHQPLTRVSDSTLTDIAFVYSS